MTGFRNFVVSCALAIASVAASVVPSSAVPLSVPDVRIDRQVDVQQVWHNGRRHYRDRDDYRPRRYYRPGIRLYVEPRPVYRDRYVRRSGYSAHVNWCLQRYRSYDPGTNRFLAYGGEYRVCRSPYR